MIDFSQLIKDKKETIVSQWIESLPHDERI